MKLEGSSSSKKSHTSITFLVGVVLCVGIVMIGLNYWHVMQCVEPNDIGDIDERAKVLEKRILEVESQVISLDIMLSCIIL
jgi:hypothetical protein